jgi:hypothetical protein
VSVHPSRAVAASLMATIFTAAKSLSRLKNDYYVGCETPVKGASVVVYIQHFVLMVKVASLCTLRVPPANIGSVGTRSSCQQRVAFTVSKAMFGKDVCRCFFS